MHFIRFLFLFSLLNLFYSCTNSEKPKLFSKVENNISGIDFNNKIVPNDSLNILNYEYLYNGGGVSVGNLNGDNFPDVVFSGNMVPSQVYINKGGLNFQNITKESNISTSSNWITGVNLIDVNQDGLDDIYFCIGGPGNVDNFPNKLYINNGNLTFSEQAAEYGLDDKGESIQSIFFDYDLDGDLDVYLLTGGGFENSAIDISKIKSDGSSRNNDRLYRNDFDENLGHPVYTEVSLELGINTEGFGLGVTIIDVNNDFWPDIYVSNDYTSKDLLYLNIKGNYFEEQSSNYFNHFSHFSMGNDAADINNDGYIDLFTSDMLPEDIKRRKLMSGSFSQEIFKFAQKFGYGEQYMRNMLHLNNGDGSFSEIGQFSGIEMSDWTWGPLFADFDNDGYQDLYLTNGFGKDITNMDFVKYRENVSYAFSDISKLKKSVHKALDKLNPIELSNYMYSNEANYKFKNVTKLWGLDYVSISNGSSYVDLDLDGDLDILVNNINQESFIFKNNLNNKDTIGSNFIELSLKGTEKNKSSIGAQVKLFLSDNQVLVRYNQPSKGFQSTSSSLLHFGLGDNEIDSLVVTWPDKKTQSLIKPSYNQILEIDYFKSEGFQKLAQKEKPLVSKSSLLNHIQIESNHSDYSIQQLLHHTFSNNGPSLAISDLNSDGLEDIFIGGPYGQHSTIYYQGYDESFTSVKIEGTEFYEDQGVIIEDFNSDGLLDIFITSGGSERYKNHKGYKDRLYVNKGDFFEEIDFPVLLSSTSTVSAGDFDNDGDMDLFVGGRVIPGQYPTAPNSYIFENKRGEFIDVTSDLLPELNKLGMVTSSIWTNYNNDEYIDLIIVGEFMPITIFEGSNNGFQKTELKNTRGLWNSIQGGDIDNDGDIDYVLGNIGLNSEFHASKKHPLNLKYADFDSNGSLDFIFSQFEQGNYYPIVSLDDLSSQIPILRKNFMQYSEFANASTKDILNSFEGITVNDLCAEVLESSILINNLSEGFDLKPLPNEVQFSSVYGILLKDINSNGFLDLISVGNTLNRSVKFGNLDASFGNILINNKNGSFDVLRNDKSGFFVDGEARSIVSIFTSSTEYILVGRNNDSVLTFKINQDVNKRFEPKFKEKSANIYFDNELIRKVEFSKGSGYLSQLSNSFKITKEMRKIITYDSKGNELNIYNQ
jgi:hypothetical protein